MDARDVVMSGFQAFEESANRRVEAFAGPRSDSAKAAIRAGERDMIVRASANRDMAHE